MATMRGENGIRIHPTGIVISRVLSSFWNIAVDCRGRSVQVHWINQSDQDQTTGNQSALRDIEYAWRPSFNYCVIILINLICTLYNDFASHLRNIRGVFRVAENNAGPGHIMEKPHLSTPKSAGPMINYRSMILLLSWVYKICLPPMAFPIACYSWRTQNSWHIGTKSY